MIGEGGRTIKAIGTAARKEIAEANERNVHSSCSSRCARTGSTIPSATGRWGWSFQRDDPLSRTREGAGVKGSADPPRSAIVAPRPIRSLRSQISAGQSRSALAAR